MATAAQLTNVRDPNAPLTEAQRYQVVMPTEKWTNQYAITIVKDSVDYMESFLQSAGHYSRWAAADEQFVGWRPQTFWDGTRRPKARIPVMLLFSQLQSLLPAVLSAMFPLHENVDVAPRPGSTFEQATAAWELIMAQLEALGEDGLKRFRLIADEVFTQAFLYGNGILEIGWLYKVIQKICAEVSWEAPKQWVYNDVTGQHEMAPVGELRRAVRDTIHKYVLNQPDIRCIDIRQFLIDPDCRTPFVQDARMAGTVHDMTVGELITYRGQPGFNIPDDYTLIKMSEQKLWTQSDQAQQQSATIQGRQWNVQDDFTNDPYQKHIKVHRWFNRERHVWLLNKQWVGFNAPNTYKLIPFLNAFYVPFPNRFHGLSLADVTEGDQYLQAGLLEARVNELSLALSAPFVRKQGTMLGATGTIPMSPSKVIDVNDEPAKAIMRLDVQAQTQQVFMEVNDSERRTAKNTGLSDMAVAGVAQAAGNSANRTAAGVEAQKGATSARIQFLVENAESSLIEPLCTVMHQYNTIFLPRDQMIDILGVNGKQQSIDPVQVLNANPRFTMRAAQRMRQRQQVMQVMPWIVQTMMNPEMISMMADQQQMTLDVGLLVDWIMDNINAPKIKLWRALTSQEQSQRNQPPPEAQMKMQQLQMRLQNAIQLADKKGDTELLNTLLGKVITPRAAEDMFGMSDPAHMTAAAQSRLHGVPPPPPMGGMPEGANPMRAALLAPQPAGEMGMGG
jgi:hypothetical protein